MDRRTQRVLAVVFSFLIVTATLAPATAALEPPSQSVSENSLASLSDSLAEVEFLPRILGNGNGNGNDGGKGTTQTTVTTTPPETTTSPPGGPPTTTQKTTQDPPGNETGGPPGNETEGPPGNKTQDPPGNKTSGPPEDSGPPENKTTGPPEDPGPPGNKTTGPPEDPGPPEDRGPPEDAGPPEDEDRGPPEWAQNPETPPSIAHNRSALANRSKPLANASVNVTINDDASAADYRLAAIAVLQQADFDGPGRSAQRHRTAALKALNETLPYVLDANRTTSAVLFEHDKEASTPPQFAPNVTKLLVHSDEQLAATAITDAERVRETLRARNVSFNESVVEENITAAEAAVERAERFRNRGQHHTAISQYRVAWIHAQQALDVLDLATRPNVTITTRGDLPHEENVTYELRGRVFDVRGHELTAVVSLNGANRTLALDVNATPETTPGAVATFRTNLTLSEQINTIEVHATDPNRRWAPDYDDVNATTGRDVLRLDGDGLPDTYEQNVVGTDPLDPDSNATQTASNESENNISDGAEDLDGDGETVYEAYRFGLDPLDNDTDGDRLLDGFELQFRGLDPATNDTDNDSVADPIENLDNDTLSNLREQNASTNPVRADTDLDGLNDSAEVANGTDPLAPDTDSDGLTDPDEYEVGTDPLDNDTDDDGVLDGNETFSTETKNESVGAAVNISGEGNVADTVTIQNDTNDQIQTKTVSNASASEVLHVDADAEFEEANLSIDYDEKQVENESSLAVYTYDPKLQTYRKLPSKVDAENDSVTGTTPHFSTFVVLNKSEWEAYMESRAKPKPRFALNESFSDLGGWNCTGDCSTGGGRVVVGQNSSAFFSDEADAECGGPHLPDNGECIGDGGGSDDDDDNESDDDPSTPSPPPSLGSANLTKSLTIPSDTVELTATGPVSAFAEESNASVTVAIQVGAETRRVLELDGKDGERESKNDYIDETFENPTGETVRIWVRQENLSGASLPYLDVEKKRDSDGDGLTNSLEKLGIKTGDGDRVYTDPYDADTDGDGISDGKEVAGHIARYVDGGYFELESDPTEVDSDGDGIDDYEETYNERTVKFTKSSNASKKFLAALYNDDSDPGNHLTPRSFKTDPILADTDDDGIPDGKELEFGTDPSRADTDGDGIPDADELDSDGDPTLHDHRGPEIGILSAAFETTALPPETRYVIGYTASDPSGVTRVQYVKDGETRIDSTFPDAPDGASGTREFTTGPVESVESSLGGATVDVKATDGNDNTRQVVALERTNFYGEVADEIGSDDIYGEEIAARLGLLSGFSTGAGGTVQTLKAVAENPLSFLDSITQVVTILRNLGLLEEIIKAFPKKIEEKQDRNNPYDEDSEGELYTEYRDGWYGGYISYALVSMVVGGQATKAAKNTKTFGKIVDTLDRNGRLTTASKYLDAVEARTTGKAKRVTFKLGARAAKGSAHLGRKSGRRVLSGVKTASAKYDVRRKLSSAEGGTLSKFNGYNERVQEKVGQVLVRSDSPKKVADGGRNYVDLLADLDDIDLKTARRLNKLERDGADVTPLVRAYKNGDIDGNDLRRTSKLLDDSNGKYLRDEDVSAKDLLKVEEKGGDLSETHAVIRPSDSYNADTDIVWLERGDKNTGWVHIKGRHVHGDIKLDTKKITSFFPLGQTIKGRDLPDRLSKQEVKEMVYRAVKKSDNPKKGSTGDLEYTYNPNREAVDEIIIRVNPDSGKITAAIPDGESDFVKQWISAKQDWLENIKND